MIGLILNFDGNKFSVKKYARENKVAYNIGCGREDRWVEIPKPAPKEKVIALHLTYFAEPSVLIYAYPKNASRLLNEALTQKEIQTLDECIVESKKPTTKLVEYHLRNQIEQKSFFEIFPSTTYSFELFGKEFFHSSKFEYTSDCGKIRFVFEPKFEMYVEGKKKDIEFLDSSQYGGAYCEIWKLDNFMNVTLPAGGNSRTREILVRSVNEKEVSELFSIDDTIWEDDCPYFLIKWKI